MVPGIGDFLMRDIIIRSFLDDPLCNKIILSLSLTPGFLSAYYLYRDWGFTVENTRIKKKEVYKDSRTIILPHCLVMDMSVGRDVLDDI